MPADRVRSPGPFFFEVHVYALEVVTAPAEEPVTLAEAKLHLRVDVDDDDALISGLITAARIHAETVTGRAFVTTRFAMHLDAFPCWGLALPRPRLQSITSIEYVDANGDEQTLAADDYQVDAVREPGRVTPAFGLSWPATREQMNAVTITYDAGYGDAAAVPAGIKDAIKVMVGDLYANRESVVIGASVSEITSRAAGYLLGPYIVGA